MIKFEITERSIENNGRKKIEKKKNEKKMHEFGYILLFFKKWNLYWKIYFKLYYYVFVNINIMLYL